jgi:hypothetical protein
MNESTSINFWKPTLHIQRTPINFTRAKLKRLINLPVARSHLVCVEAIQAVATAALLPVFLAVLVVLLSCSGALEELTVTALFANVLLPRRDRELDREKQTTGCIK